MKITGLILVLMLFMVVAPESQAQSGAGRGPDPSTLRDPELEKESMHNLNVARQYFKLKKAYVAALRRCEEIIAGNPTFSKIDETLYIAGMSSLYLSQDKGKQRASLYLVQDGGTMRPFTPEEFRSEAKSYLTQLVRDFPDSPFRQKAEKELQSLGGN